MMGGIGLPGVGICMLSALNSSLAMKRKELNYQIKYCGQIEDLHDVSSVIFLSRFLE